MEEKAVAYSDLKNAKYVFDGLVGFGYFCEKLPNCFTSEGFLDFVNSEQNDVIPSHPKSHHYMEYRATKNNSAERIFAIPHPESYLNLCLFIKENWQKINEHIGKVEKVNFCHVKKQKNSKAIFEISYKNGDKFLKEENEINYSLGCHFIVKADISKCFPSIYTHSIPWAIHGIEKAKKNRKDQNDWANQLDFFSRQLQDQQTNGLPIGPHSSNIISEIILTQIDNGLMTRGMNKFVRMIDDYTFYAKNRNEAKSFLKILSLELSKYDLLLNSKKSQIIEFEESVNLDWVGKLNLFSFPKKKDEYGFTTINSYINYALTIALEHNDYAVLNYAIKVISSCKLTKRAGKLYVKKILQFAILHPYLNPLIEKYVLLFSNDITNDIHVFVKELLNNSIDNNSLDGISFALFYAVKYNIEMFDSAEDKSEVCANLIDANDAVSLLMFYFYAKLFAETTELDIIKKYAIKINKSFNDREKDKHWLFLYEVLESKQLKGFLKKMKMADITFVDFLKK